MPTYVVVNATDGTFRVHRSGCRDIEKTPRNGRWDAVAPDVKTLIANELTALAKDFGDSYDESYFVVLPCTKEAQ